MTITAALTDVEAVAAAKDAKLYQRWMRELKGAEDNEKDFRKQAQEAISLYENHAMDANPYAILYSNTETLAPALYSATPQPTVQRRFKDNDQLGFVAARTAQRLLVYQLDNGSAEYPQFDDLMHKAVLAALVPGRGVTRFKYEAAYEKLEGAEKPDEDEAEEGGEPPADEDIASEVICGETVPWDQFRHGYALSWQKVPWIAYEHWMDKEELEENFGELAEDIQLLDVTDDSDKSNSSRPQKAKGLKVAQVFEIWDKHSKTQLFISVGLPDRILKKTPDPYKLQGFFDCPEPLQFTSRLKGLTPIPLHVYYKKQADELNQITNRIRKLIAAARVRGMYDSQIEGIEKALEADDGKLIPADNVAALQSQGSSGLDKAIWLFPLEKLVAILQQLYTQREQIKQIIFEITGIADIMRGSTMASETLGAQQLKNQWGTLRLKKSQQRVAHYATNCLRIIAEMAFSRLGIDTLSQMTGLNYPRLAQKQQAQAALQQMQMQAQQQAAIAQQTGQPPAPPPQPDPQLMQIAQSPAWEEILALLQNDLQRSYRIDIETNSTVDVEATEDKKDIGELLQAISQFLQAVGPLVQSGQMPFQIMQSMLLAITRRFRFGDEVEEQLRGMQAPPPQNQNPELEKRAKEIEKQSHQLSEEQNQFKLHVQEELGKIKLERQAFDMHKQLSEQELKMKAEAAGQQIEQTAQQHLDKVSQAEQLAQQQHQLREQGLKDSEARASATLKTQKQDAQHTAQTAAKGQGDTQALLQQVTQIVADLQKTVNTPRKAVKQPDGSWVAGPHGA